jgi:sarcosine oxidase gamma subunit
VAELRTLTPTVHAVLATPEGCDIVATGTQVVCLSPNETMVVGDLDTAALERAVRDADPDALVVDVTDGWAAVVLEGAGSRAAFARLSELELPGDGALAGEVARIGVRVIASGDRLTLLVPAMLAAYLEDRVRTDCAELLA